MKMYILLRKGMTRGFATVAAAHASLKCYLEFKDHPDMTEWLAKSFRKVTCVADDRQFERAKREGLHVIITESNCDYEEQALAFCPREDYPKWFRNLPLHK